jgi:hypothetical protein
MNRWRTYHEGPLARIHKFHTDYRLERRSSELCAYFHRLRIYKIINLNHGQRTETFIATNTQLAYLSVLFQHDYL